jgi:hypothetical protein
MATKSSPGVLNEGMPAIYGIDLDGILVADVPSAHYQSDLASALDARDSLSPLSPLPHFDPQRAIIITGRPEHDRPRSEAWLAKHGFGHHKLLMRDPRLHEMTWAATARYKAEAALREGCTIFIESELPQAVEISLQAPGLRVIWWNIDSRRATVINASPWDPGATG